MKEMRNIYKILAGKYERKILQKNHKHTFKNNIQINVKTLFDEVDYFRLDRRRSQWKPGLRHETVFAHS
jgi:hypothetical protein